MEKLTLQQLINETMDALNQTGASSYYKTVFKTLTKQFLIYAKDKGVDSFSMDFALQFLEDHYSMSAKIAQKKMVCSLFTMHECFVRVPTFGECKSLSVNG